MEKKMIMREIFIGMLIVAVSLVIITVFIPQQIQLATTFGSEIGVNSRTFPYFTAAIIGIAAAIHLLMSCVKYVKLRREENNKQDTSEKNLHGEILAIIIFILFTLYAFLFNKFGYIVSSLIVPPLVLFILGSRKIKHYLSMYGFIILIFVIFQYLLNIQLIR